VISWDIGHIYCNQTWRKKNQEISYPKLALSPACSQATGEEFHHGEGLERDYELRSRGPALLGAKALDNLVSRSRQSSPTRSTQSSTVVAPHPSPPPSPPTTTASSTQPLPMAEPTIKDVMEALQSITTEMSTLKSKG
jgi:hypothetical protein